MKFIPSIAAILAIIGTALAGYLFLDAHFAKCEEVKAIERRLDYKIESDKLTATQSRLWTLEDRYGADPDRVPDKHVKQQMKELKSDLDGLQHRVKQFNR